MNRKIVAVCLGALLSAGATPALASYWQLGSGTTDSSASVSVSAWSNTAGFSASVAENTNTSTASGTIESASMSWYSGGWGVKNNDACTTSNCAGWDANEGGQPEHAIDNDQRYDSVLLNFGTTGVNLSDLRSGYASDDSDVTVLAYTGAAPFNSNVHLNGLGYDQLLSNGWSLIGHYSNAFTLGSVTSTRAITNTVYSSAWLVGAYNPTVGSNQGWTLGNDHFKLYKVFGSVCDGGSGASGGSCGGGVPNTGVPEPASLALAGLGLFGLYGMRRRRSA